MWTLRSPFRLEAESFRWKFSGVRPVIGGLTWRKKNLKLSNNTIEMKNEKKWLEKIGGVRMFKIEESKRRGQIQGIICALAKIMKKKSKIKEENPLFLKAEWQM